MTWVHRSPDASGEWETVSAGWGESLSRSLQLDAMGRDVGLDNPYDSGGDGLGGYPTYDDPTDMTSGCSIDHDIMPCDFVIKFAMRDQGTRLYLITHSRIGVLQPNYDTKAVLGGSTSSTSGSWEIDPNRASDQNIGTVTVTAGADGLMNSLAGFNMVWLSFLPTVIVASRKEMPDRPQRLDPQRLKECINSFYGGMKDMEFSTDPDNLYFKGKWHGNSLFQKYVYDYDGEIPIHVNTSMEKSGREFQLGAGGIRGTANFAWGFTPLQPSPLDFRHWTDEVGDPFQLKNYVANEASMHGDLFVESKWVYELGNALHRLTGEVSLKDIKDPSRYGPLHPDDVGGALLRLRGPCH